MQTTAPAYVPSGGEIGPVTGQGAIELVAHQYDEEAALAELRDALVVRGVRIADNRIDLSATAAVRIGYGWGERDAHAVDDAGTLRFYSGAAVTDVTVEANTITRVSDGMEVVNRADPALVLACAGNTVDGAVYTHEACGVGPGANADLPTSCS